MSNVVSLWVVPLSEIRRIPRLPKMISGNVRVEFHIFSLPQGDLQSNVQAKEADMLIIKLKSLEFYFSSSFLFTMLCSQLF